MPQSTVSSSRKRGMRFILLFSVVAFSYIGWLLVRNVPILLYDARTEKTGRILDRWDEDQWQQLYDEVRPVFLSHLPGPEKNKTVNLGESDLPPPLRDLGFDRVYATSEGVHLLRIGGGVNLHATWIHCIYRPAAAGGDGYKEEYAPEAGLHDRKGIWFHGFREQRWAYEVRD